MYEHEPEDISEIDPLSRFTRATLYEGDVYAAWHAAEYVENLSCQAVNWLMRSRWGTGMTGYKESA